MQQLYELLTLSYEQYICMKKNHVLFEFVLSNMCNIAHVKKTKNSSDFLFN